MYQVSKHSTNKNEAEEVNLDEIREVRRKETCFEILIGAGGGGETAQNVCEHTKWVAYMRFDIGKVGKW